MATATLKKIAPVKNSATIKKIAAARSYAALVKMCPPRIVRDAKSLEYFYEIIDRLMAIEKPSADQLDYLELLSTIVEQYEASDHPTPHTSVASLLGFLLESKSETQMSLAAATDIQKSLISEVLSGRRKLSIANIKKLAKHFSVDPGLFIECSEAS
jgi:HTH-type transcriptional regulator / antitoxin HigA